MDEPLTVTEASCTECDDEEAYFRTIEHENEIGADEETEPSVTREVACTCGATGTIHVTEEGTEASGAVSHENAAWNEEEEE